MQAKSAPATETRRAFLKRIALGMTGLSAAALVSRNIAGGQASDAGLPGPGSIFEPRQADLRSHWVQRLSRFRLR
ncbi:MAG: hypothetical protein HY532_07710 [Chloroflexi bacterium]|nr:hypothetical protein [Chloroflexota bacterium]